MIKQVEKHQMERGNDVTSSQFRAIAGFVNQEIVKMAHRIVMTVAGIDV